MAASSGGDDSEETTPVLARNRGAKDSMALERLVVQLDRKVDVAHRDGSARAVPLLHHDRQSRSHERPPEGAQLLLSELPERFRPAPDPIPGRARLKTRRRRSRTGRIAKDMEEGDRDIP